MINRIYNVIYSLHIHVCTYDNYTEYYLPSASERVTLISLAGWVTWHDYDVFEYVSDSLLDDVVGVCVRTRDGTRWKVHLSRYLHSGVGYY